jgi:hypothetical protein
MRDAVIAVCKCPETKKTYGIRIEKWEANQWEMTWAFPIKEDSARREGYDSTTVSGHVTASAEFPGCPYCQSTNIVVCGSCGKIFCNTGGENHKCPWCGTIGKLDTGGGGVSFKTGGDR